MNKVWLVLQTIPYEGDDIIGIYASETLAMIVLEAMRLTPCGYSYSVEEMAVQGE